MEQKKISIHFLKWIICNGLKSTAEISAVPMGLHKIFQPAKSQRLGRFIKVSLQSDRQQPKAQNKEPAARPIFFEPSNLQWIKSTTKPAMIICNRLKSHNNSCNDNLQWIEIPQQHLQWIEIHSSNISRPDGTYKPA